MKKIVEKAAEVVRNGGVILYPTDTIWGLGCDPANPDAVEKLLALKKRMPGKSLIVLVHSEALLQRYAKVIPEVCYDLIDYANKPLTIIYPEGQHVAPQILANDGSIAIRLTQHNFCKQLMQKTKGGIVSTSANISGEPYKGDLAHISQELKEGVDYIVDVPLENKNAAPSQIIKIGANSEVTIIRK